MPIRSQDVYSVLWLSNLITKIIFLKENFYLLQWINFLIFESNILLTNERLSYLIFNNILAVCYMCVYIIYIVAIVYLMVENLLI
jgi:hypothetical protein